MQTGQELHDLMFNFQEKQASSQEIIRVYKCVHSGVYCDQALVGRVCSCQCVQTIPDVWNALMTMASASFRIAHYFPGQGLQAITISNSGRQRGLALQRLIWQTLF